MQGVPPPLAWPLVVPLEVAACHLEAAHQALDQCFLEPPQPSDPEALGAALMAALHDAGQASVLENFMRLDAPGRQ